MKRVAVAGNLILDVMKRIESFPQIGMLANIGETSYAVGGCVCNTAIDLKRLCPDFEVSAFGKVGDDDYAKTGSSTQEGPAAPKADEAGFMNVPEGAEDLPFN